MKAKPQFWKQVWGEVAEQLFDLVSGPNEKPVYPCSSQVVSVIQERCGSLEWPQSLLRIDEIMSQDLAKGLGTNLGDWAAIYQYQILTSMGLGDLSRYFRDRVVQEARVEYADAES